MLKQTKTMVLDPSSLKEGIVEEIRQALIDLGFSSLCRVEKFYIEAEQRSFKGLQTEDGAIILLHWWNMELEIKGKKVVMPCNVPEKKEVLSGILECAANIHAAFKNKKLKVRIFVPTPLQLCGFEVEEYKAK